MSASVWADLSAVARCWRLGSGLPAAMWLARRDAPKFLAAFDRCVWPLLNRTVSGPARREDLRFALGSTSVKVSYLLCAYAAMVGVPFRSDLAALMGAYARLYDDLLDERESGDLQRRLTILFAGGSSTSAVDELELLAERIYLATVQSLQSPARELFCATMAELHSWQVRSEMQKRSSVDDNERDAVIARKGGQANLLLLGLIHPDMTAQESELVCRLGEVLQLLDDYQDVELDRHSGIATAATAGQLALSTIGDRLRACGSAFATRHGNRPARAFQGVLFLQLVVAFVRRHLPTLSSLARAPKARTWTPLRMLIEPGGNAVGCRL